MKSFYVYRDANRGPNEFKNPTGWEKDTEHPGGSRREMNKFSVEEHPVRYDAFDDDGNFMASGTCTDDGIEDAFDHHMNDVGATYLELYDRKTGKSGGRYG